MSQLGWSLASLVLFLVSLPVLSVGTSTETRVVWVIGLALVALAGAIPPALRYLPPGGSDEDGTDEGDAGDAGDETGNETAT
jgi:hypothetical protein